ncbi:MAG: hypothetical protein DRN11_03440 [Thermoplasmata archaeon]|nr:MAG: hypothetical protein DRN11_03440 [Thermoplasmata archaeon]
MANLRGNKMYGKKLMKKVGSLVIVATIIASAFVVMPFSTIKAEGDGSHDVGISLDYYSEGNGIKIFHDGNLVAPGENLLVGEEYTIRFRIINEGDVNETVNVTLEILKDSTVVKEWQYDKFVEAGGYSDSYRVWNTTGLEIGDYTIRVNVSIPYDENWTNNERTRDIVLEDTLPPVISNVAAVPEEQKAGGYVNITCDVNDNAGIAVVKVNIEGPEGFETKNETMLGGSYYYNTTYNIVGTYSYYIWAEDINGNTNKSPTYTFEIVPNFEVKPKSGNYMETVTLEVYNATAGDTVQLWKPGNIKVAENWADANGRVTFSNVLLDTVGDWIIKDVEKGWEIIFEVKPSPLTITVSPSEVIYEQAKGVSGYQFNITVKDKDGNYVENAKVIAYWIDENGVNQPALQVNISQSGGNYTIKVRGLAGVGIYNITVTKNTTGDETPELGGYVHAKIMPNTLIFAEDPASEEARQGFPSKKVFVVKYADTNASLDWTKPTNITISYGDEKNSTGDITIDDMPVNITVAGKEIKIYVQDNKLVIEAVWPEKGTWTLGVSQNYEGNSLVDNKTYEYEGETTFEVVTPPPVNVYVSPEKLDVKDPANNTQIINITILGNAINVYGSPENLSIGPNNENVTERIKIEGDVLYSPPADAYEYIGDGIWQVKVFPTCGGGTIYINVTWPGNETVSKTVTIEEGRVVDVTPTEVTVDEKVNVTVTAKDRYGNNIANANVSLIYETGLYQLDGEIISMQGDGSPGKGQGGVYEFTNVTSTKANTNIIVVVNYLGIYGYARIWSKPAHDLNAVLSPDKVLAGAHTEFSINVTNATGAYDEPLYFYLLNESNLAKFHEDASLLEGLAINITGIVNKVSKGNYTFKYNITKEGKYYLYIATTDFKHDVAAGEEPSFEVTRATVSVDPSLLVKNVDKNVTLEFTVEWEGTPVNGTLKVIGIQEITSYEAYIEGAIVNVTIINGKGNLTNVTAIAVGNITFEFKAETAGSVFVKAEGKLEVTTPSVEIIEPKEKIAFLGEENLITIKVKHPLTNKGCQGLDVEIETPSSNGRVYVGETDENGELLFGIIPLQTGKIKIYVEGEEVGSIEIWIGLKIVVPSEIEAGKETTILVTTRGGKPIEGATVKVDGETIGTTNENGEIKYKPKEAKTITITAEKTGYYSAKKTVEVKKAAEGAPGFELIGFCIAALVAIILWRRRK